MPTPTRCFAELAARHGGVDPDDLAAVVRWYHDVVPTLPGAEIESLLEELLAREGEEAGAPAESSYGRRPSLPSLAASPHVPPPFLAVGFLKRLLASMRRRGGGATDRRTDGEDTTS